MLQKVLRTGNNMIVALPQEVLETLGMHDGTEVSVEFDAKNRQIVIRPIDHIVLRDVDETFARQVNEFIEQYRPALQALAGV